MYDEIGSSQNDHSKRICITKSALNVLVHVLTSLFEISI